MVTDENVPNSMPTDDQGKLSDADKKGQMLVIYLPEGSVIVDRTDISLSNTPPKIAEVIAPAPTPRVEERPKPKEATLQEVVQLAVQEVMQKTTPPRPQTEIPPHRVVRPHVPRLTHGIHFPRRRFNWMHAINILLVVYITLATIVPAVLMSALDISIYAAKTSHPAVAIARGDLMVSHQIPVSTVKTNDVVLVRSESTWRLDVRQVISRTSGEKNSTLTTASTRGQEMNQTSPMANDAKVFKVTTIVPGLGYVPMVLTDTVTKVLGGLFVLLLNVWAHFRRDRRRNKWVPTQPL